MKQPDHVITCVYCGQAYPKYTPADGADVAVLTAHIKVCPKHPMRALEAELGALRIRNIELQGFAEQALSYLDQGGNASVYDPSWIRPKALSQQEVKEACIQAYHWIHKLLEQLRL
jgi:hypothetical protein